MQFDPTTLKITLSSIENDWKSREESLHTLLKSFAIPTEATLTFELVANMPEHLAYQFADLRSGIVKLASEVIMAFSKAANGFNEETSLAFADKFLQESSFFKALGNGNKVIAKHANNALKSLTTNNCLSLEILRQLFNSQRNNKINSIRENVAQTFSLFISQLNMPLKTPLKSIFYVPVFPNEENQENSKTKSSSKSIKNVLAIETETKIDGNILFAGSDHDLSLVTQNIKEENFGLLKTACEVFLKDVSPNVRNFGKEIKLSISKIQDLFLSGQETALSQFSNDFNEEIDCGEKFRDEGNTGMIIETASNDNNVSKTTNSLGYQSRQLQLKNMSVESKILRLLNSESKTAKDQTEELEKLLLVANSLLVFSFEEYCKLLELFHAAKNLNFKATLTRILTKSDLSNFQFEILDFLLKEKMHKRSNYNQIAKYIIDKVSFEVLLQMIITRTYEDLIYFVNKSFCPKKLQKCLAKCEIEAQEIVSAIQRNFTKSESSQVTNLQLYRTNNLLFLQKVFGDSLTRQFFQNLEWTPMFLDKLKDLQLYSQFLQITTPQNSQLSFLDLLQWLSLNPNETEILRKINEIIGEFLDQNFKFEISGNLNALLIQKKLPDISILSENLIRQTKTNVMTLTTANNRLCVDLSLLLIWTSAHGVQSPQILADWLVFMVEVRKVLSGDMLTRFYEDLADFWNSSPVNLTCIYQLLSETLKIELVCDLLEFLKTPFLALKESKEFPKMCVLVNSEFLMFVQLFQNSLLRNQNLEVRKLSVQVIANIKPFVQPDNFVAFCNGLNFELQNLISIYTQN